jgi:enamine deaminase RidA (YjgF/YER057c/UK114 family)
LLAHSWFFTENKLGVSPVPTIQCLNPDSMAKPAAPYSNIARVKASEFLFIAGQIGIGKDGKAPADFEAQCALVFESIGAALASQGAGFPNIVSFTSYLVHSQDIPKFAAYRAREFPRLFPGGAFPPNTLLVIDRLVREDLLVEVEAVAAL